jgi:cytolysin-activating lysine-acyltransferase
MRRIAMPADGTPDDLLTLAAEQARRVVRQLPVLGPVAWLMMHDAATRHDFVADLAWRVMPPLVLEQSRLYARGPMPTAFATWAFLSDEALRHYRAPPYRLRPGEWKSGDMVFVVDIVAPYGGVDEVLADLRRTALAGLKVHRLAAASQGIVDVVELGAG